MTQIANSLVPKPASALEAAMAGWATPGTSIAIPGMDTMPAVMPDPMTALGNLSLVPNATPGFMDKMLGYRGPDGTQFNGWGGMALGAANGLMNGFLGMQSLGIAKDQLAQGKKQFEMNWGAQQKLTNSRLEDRQAARRAAGGNAYQSVGDYMKKNGI